MKLKKKFKTKFDYSIRMFFTLSLILFIFSLCYLLPKTYLTIENNISLKNEIASLETNNDTLKAVAMFSTGAAQPLRRSCQSEMDWK